MKNPLFPQDENLELFWWHRLAREISNVILWFSIAISLLILGYYLNQVRKIQKIKAISEKIEISTVLKRKPGQDKMYPDELGITLKKQNPQYNDISDRNFALAVMYKYPSYREYSNYYDAYFEPNTDLLSIAPYLIIGALILPSLIYRLILPFLT